MTTPRLLALALTTAAAALLPAATASADVFRGATAAGEEISFSYADGQVSEIVSSVEVRCSTGASGRDAFYAVGPFAGDGTPGSVTGTRTVQALRRNLDVTQTFTGTVTGGQAHGSLRIEASEPDYDVITGVWSTTTCAGEVAFTATQAGIVPGPAVPTHTTDEPKQDSTSQPPAKQKPSKKKKKKKKKKRGGRG